MANSRQIALRERLRNHYWLTECKPISNVTIELTRRKMLMIDAKDKMNTTEVAELLSTHYGFHETDSGYVIPDMDESRGVAIKSGEINISNGSRGGIQKAANAAAAKAGAIPKVVAAVDPDDF